VSNYLEALEVANVPKSDITLFIYADACRTTCEELTGDYRTAVALKLASVTLIAKTYSGAPNIHVFLVPNA
jgi:hypothetical protein